MFRSTIGRALAAVLALGAASGAAHADAAFQNGLPEGAIHKLKELIRNDSRIKCIAFTSTGGWVILFDDNGFIARGIPDDAFDKLKELADDDAVLRWIAFTPTDGFVILANKSTFFARDIPLAGLRRLKAASDDGLELKSMTFCGRNGWVLIWDGGFLADGIPSDLFRSMQKLNLAGEHLKSVAFAPSGGWALLLNRDGALDSSIPEGAFAKIDELQKLGGCRFHCIAFPPNADEAWVLIAD